MSEMCKQNVVYVCVMDCYLEKEGGSDTCCNIYEAWGHCPERNKPVTKW